MNIFNSFLLTFISGFSTLLGFFIIFINEKYKNRIINGSLSFAAGVMITISLVDLIPEAYHFLYYNNTYKILLILTFIVAGVCFSILMDRLVKKDNYLYKIGIVSLFSIILHNIPEGIITFITANNSSELGIKLTLAIALHNIPEGISIAVPLYYSTKSKSRVLALLLLSAISEPLGALIGLLFSGYINNNILGMIYAFIVGLMLFISIYEILPVTSKYKKYGYSIILFGVGCVLMIISLIFM